MAYQPEHYRASAPEQWDRVATGWSARREHFQAAVEPVSRWLVDAIVPRPGHHVLELAAGPGDTGLMAAREIAPDGQLISSDAAEGMLEAGRARAAELGITGVDFRILDAESIDLPAASQDGVICRWGYMLLADPGAALRETRRVLRPGGRVALAAWSAPEQNPWMSVPSRVLLEQGLVEEPDPRAPGPFSWGDQAIIERTLAEAGFADVRVESLELEFAFDSFDVLWDFRADLSPGLAELLPTLNERQLTALREGTRQVLEPFADAAGAYRFPARTHVATAEA